MTGPAVESPPRGGARHRLVGYLAVGVVSYVIDVGLLILLRDLADAPLLLATTVGFWASVLFNFLANRWVFSAKDKGSASAHASRYALLLLVNYALTIVIVQGGVALGVDAVLAKTLAVGLIACSNFVLYRRWVYA